MKQYKLLKKWRDDSIKQVEECSFIHESGSGSTFFLSKDYYKKKIYETYIQELKRLLKSLRHLS